MPFATAFGLEGEADFDLTDAWRLALAVVFGEFEGGDFDWTAGRWKKRG